MTFTIEFDRETDGRFIAEVPELPGVLAYGATHDEARLLVIQLAHETIADMVIHGEITFVERTVAA